MLAELTSLISSTIRTSPGLPATADDREAEKFHPVNARARRRRAARAARVRNRPEPHPLAAREPSVDEQEAELRAQVKAEALLDDPDVEKIARLLKRRTALLKAAAEPARLDAAYARTGEEGGMWVFPAAEQYRRDRQARTRRARASRRINRVRARS